MIKRLNNIPGYIEFCVDVVHYPDKRSQHYLTKCMSNFSHCLQVEWPSENIAFPVRNKFCIYSFDSYTALISWHLNESPYTEIFLKAKSTDGRCQNVIKLKYKQFFLWTRINTRYTTDVVTNLFVCGANNAWPKDIVIKMWILLNGD